MPSLCESLNLSIIKAVKFSGLAFFALFLAVLIAGNLFAVLILHMLDHYFCPFNGSEFCNGVEKLLIHLTYLKNFFLSLFPVFFAFLLGFASYLLREKERLKKLPPHLYFRPENLCFLPQRQLRWLAIHTNSPTIAL